MSDAPNVLLVVTDHWPGRLFGHRGAAGMLTPTCDELARAGTVFVNATSECPVCIPARRTLMTGLSPRQHGDRVYRDRLPMPDSPTLAGSLAAAGWQCWAAGKLHVYPQRDRIGFHDVALCEEGRLQFGCVDDYEVYLAEQGLAGQGYGHGMGNNQYHPRPWHLDARHHTTNWITREACRQIKRRDPTRPGFWYVGYVAPHPPLVPPRDDWELYRDVPMPEPLIGEWARDPAALPARLRRQRLHDEARYPAALVPSIQRAFRASCTQIDHQLRLIIGTLREEGLLDNTLIIVTADHGDTLGMHGFWAKRSFYQDSCGIPCIISGAVAGRHFAVGTQDRRLIGLADLMPTILEACGLEAPAGIAGQSLISGQPRRHAFAEIGEGVDASRMIRDQRHKLIWYPVGNRIQLFDLDADPDECHDRADDPSLAPIRSELERLLIEHLHGGDEHWVNEGRLVGEDDPGDSDLIFGADPGLQSQRGWQHPPPAAH